MARSDTTYFDLSQCILHYCFVPQFLAVAITSRQDLEEVLSGCPEQLDFPAVQVTSDGPRPRQVVCPSCPGQAKFESCLSEGQAGILRACSHGSGVPQAGEVPRPGGVTNLSIHVQSLFFS